MKEIKSFAFELKEFNGEDGMFDGYASTFVKIPDAYGDVVDKGAFAKTIKENQSRIKILWSHMILEPIGKPVEMREDDLGLYVKGKLTTGVQRAREVLELMKDKVVTEMSIGFETIKEEFSGSGRDQVRHLKEIKLWDVSPVTYAANATAMILNAKAAEYAMKAGKSDDIKAALEELMALLVEYKTLEGEPEESTHDDEGAAELERILEKISSDLEADLEDEEGIDEVEAERILEAAISYFDKE